MPVRSHLFRPGAGTPPGPRPGHLVGIGRERQSHPSAGRFLITERTRRSPAPRPYDRPKNSNSEKRAGAQDESSSPEFDPSQRRTPRQKVELVLLVGTSRAGAYYFENEDDGVRVGAPQGRIRCPRRSTTYRPIGRSAPGSTMPNTATCMRARSAIPTASGRSRPSASDG